ETLFFAGKGGVGKSTCAAAFALAAAERGRRVLLLSVDPAGSLGEVLARPVGSGDPVRLAGLTIRQIDADRAFASFRSRYRARIAEVFERLGLSASAALDRRVLESIVDVAPPGLDEVFALDAMIEAGDDADLLVVDTAPTGHFLRLLQMPQTALAWTRSALR